MTRKNIHFPPELWAQIAEYRHAARLQTESDAVRQLVERGLRYASRALRQSTPTETSLSSPKSISDTSALSPKTDSTTAGA
jgi:hypothetical protein